MTDSNELAPAVTSDATENLADVRQDAFLRTIKALVVIAANGYPRAIRSTGARRNHLLRQHDGRTKSAALEVLEEAEDYVEEVKEFLLRLVPYIGLPAALIYPLWKQLRKTCLAASIFGHDLQLESVQASVLLAAAGLHAAPEAERALEKAAETLWQKAAGKRLAKLVPVGALVVAFADVESQVKDSTLNFFEDGPGVSEYEAELDPEPSAQDFLELLKDIGKQQLEAVLQKSKENADEECKSVYSA